MNKKQKQEVLDAMEARAKAGVNSLLIGISVEGLQGSGKTTFIHDVLIPALKPHVEYIFLLDNGARPRVDDIEMISGEQKNARMVEIHGIQTRRSEKP